MIEGGNWAPTGHNLQNWRFVVITDVNPYRLGLASTMGVADRTVNVAEEDLEPVMADLGTEQE